MSASCGPTDGAATLYLIAEGRDVSCKEGEGPGRPYLMVSLYGVQPAGPLDVLLEESTGSAQRMEAEALVPLKGARLHLDPEHGSGEITYELGGVAHRVLFTTVRCERSEPLMCG